MRLSEVATPETNQYPEHIVDLISGEKLHFVKIGDSNPDYIIYSREGKNDSYVYRRNHQGAMVPLQGAPRIGSESDEMVSPS